MLAISAETLVAMKSWRQDIHAHPELAYQEQRTADLVARELTAMGIAVHRGLGGTGVVGTLSTGAGGSIGLRADMDALPMTEVNSFKHCSKHSGVMHACGHDGHTAMLLGAARHLSVHRDFHGTVHFIFQPAEEGEAGGKAMVDDGLFEKFPCDAVYGLHNWPGMPAGQFAINHGAMTASLTRFEVMVRGRGTHAAMPERGIDPIVIACELVMALQTIPSRRIAATESAVVSVTQFNGGSAWNVIPDTVQLRGSIRCLSEHSLDVVERSLHEICENIARGHGGSAEVTVERQYPPVINTPEAVDLAIAAARAVVGPERVNTQFTPTMGSEDFAFMLQARPGAYIVLGADGIGPSHPVHSTSYDFNDDLLGVGAAYWVALVNTSLESRVE